MLFALFRSCVVGTWAVKRGLWLCESGVLHGKFSSTCWVMYVAVGSDGTTSWRLNENGEGGVCGHCFFKDAAVSHAHCGSDTLFLSYYC